MSDQQNQPGDSPDPERAVPTPAKKRYQPPSILSRESLEAMANVCNPPTGKGDPMTCPDGPINS